MFEEPHDALASLNLRFRAVAGDDDEKKLIEKTEYDVIVTYWVKHLTKRRKRIILNELKASR